MENRSPSEMMRQAVKPLHWWLRQNRVTAVPSAIGPVISPDGWLCRLALFHIFSAIHAEKEKVVMKIILFLTIS